MCATKWPSNGMNYHHSEGFGWDTGHAYINNIWQSHGRKRKTWQNMNARKKWRNDLTCSIRLKRIFVFVSVVWHSKWNANTPHRGKTRKYNAICFLWLYSERKNEREDGKKCIRNSHLHFTLGSGCTGRVHRCFHYPFSSVPIAFRLYLQFVGAQSRALHRWIANAGHGHGGRKILRKYFIFVCDLRSNEFRGEKTEKKRRRTIFLQL